MNVNNIAELSELIEEVYESIGGSHSKYDTLFQKIIGGCHCIPSTEWFGDIHLIFKKLLNENAILDKALAEQVKEIVIQFDQYFIRSI